VEATQKTKPIETFISLDGVGKRYNFSWIFSNINLRINKNDKLAILGANGSGKSTLMQCIAGFQSISEGQWKFVVNNKDLSNADHYQHIAIAAPYQELIDDFTLNEMLNFHFSIKKILRGFTIKDVIDNSGLEKVLNKKLIYFSSGMRQRVKLILAIFSDAQFLFLDEPCANFDQKAIAWYNDLIEKFALEKSILVCSNHQQFEYSFCNQTFELSLSHF